MMQMINTCSIQAASLCCSGVTVMILSCGFVFCVKSNNLFIIVCSRYLPCAASCKPGDATLRWVLLVAFVVFALPSNALPSHFVFFPFVPETDTHC